MKRLLLSSLMLFLALACASGNSGDGIIAPDCQLPTPDVSLDLVNNVFCDQTIQGVQSLAIRWHGWFEADWVNGPFPIDEYRVEVYDGDTCSGILVWSDEGLIGGGVATSPTLRFVFTPDNIFQLGTYSYRIKALAIDETMCDSEWSGCCNVGIFNEASKEFL